MCVRSSLLYLVVDYVVDCGFGKGKPELDSRKFIGFWFLIFSYKWYTFLSHRIINNRNNEVISPSRANGIKIHILVICYTMLKKNNRSQLSE